MNDASIMQTYRGVRCLSCRQPIPVPGILLRRDAIHQTDDGEPVDEFSTRVFSLRCRACEKEKPYRVCDIVDFNGEPRSRASHSRLIHAQGRKPLAHSRAAGG
jgi:hypothetical protein